MALPVKPKPRPKRKLTLNLAKLAEVSQQRSDVTVSIEQSHARQISNLPPEQYAVVVAAIRQGAKNSAIVQYFAENGWLTVTEKSFNQYLGAFKRVNAAEIRDYEDEESLDGIVRPDLPALDEEMVVEQLIRVNARRIRKGVDFELDTGLVNKDLHKDILATNTLVETLGKLRGKTAGAGRPSQQMVGVPVQAQETLRKADNSEATQDKLANLVTQLIGVTSAKAG